MEKSRDRFWFCGTFVCVFDADFIEYVCKGGNVWNDFRHVYSLNVAINVYRMVWA